jgi:antitoxin ChpS
MGIYNSIKRCFFRCLWRLRHDRTKVFVEQNGLSEGSQVELHLMGKKMTVEAPTRPRYKLVDLMAEMPGGLPRVVGWAEMPSVGPENG